MTAIIFFFLFFFAIFGVFVECYCERASVCVFRMFPYLFLLLELEVLLYILSLTVVLESELLVVVSAAVVDDDDDDVVTTHCAVYIPIMT